MRHTCKLATTAALAFALSLGGSAPLSAQTASERASVDSALAHYTRLVARMAHDSIAALYTADGELAAPGRPPIVGPVAIGDFLGSFSEYHVLAYRTTSDSVLIRGDTAYQTGQWWQEVQVPAGDTVNVKGDLSVIWLRDSTGAWRARRMSATPRRD
jgi:ketosteroid isomerase-like protein